MDEGQSNEDGWFRGTPICGNPHNIRSLDGIIYYYEPLETNKHHCGAPLVWVCRRIAYLQLNVAWYTISFSRVVWLCMAIFVGVIPKFQTHPYIKVYPFLDISRIYPIYQVITIIIIIIIIIILYISDTSGWNFH